MPFYLIETDFLYIQFRSKLLVYFRILEFNTETFSKSDAIFFNRNRDILNWLCKCYKSWYLSPTVYAFKDVADFYVFIAYNYPFIFNNFFLVDLIYWNKNRIYLISLLTAFDIQTIRIAYFSRITLIFKLLVAWVKW